MASDLTHTIVTAGEPQFWLGLCVAILLTAAAIIGAFVFIGRRRVVEDTPTALVRSAPQGYIELQGHAEFMDGDEIHAPLSMRHCVWYRYRVEQRRERTHGSRDNQWRTIDSGTSEEMFYLVDETGSCAVDPEGARVTAGHRNRWYGNSRIPGRYHESDGTLWARGMGGLGRNYRYFEERIEPGDQIYAIGNFTTHGGTATRDNKSEAVRELLREWKQDQQFMLAEFDTDGDGNIDMQEWEAARARAEQEVEEQHGEAAGPPPVDVLGRTRDRRRPFIIHHGTEEAMIASYQRWTIGLFVVAAILGSGVLWAITVRFGG